MNNDAVIEDKVPNNNNTECILSAANECNDNSRSEPPQLCESSANLTADPLNDEEETGILNWLFRRSSRRRRSWRRPARRSQSARLHRADESIPTINGLLEREGPRRDTGSGIRRSIRRIFRRNDSFYRAQRNSSIEQNDEPRSQRNNDQDQTSAVTSDSQGITSLTSPPVLIDITQTQMDNGDVDRPLRSESTRRSVRFSTNRSTSPSDDSSHPVNSVESRLEPIIRSLLPPPLGTRVISTSNQTSAPNRDTSTTSTRDERRNSDDVSSGSVNEQSYRERSSLVMESDEDRAKRVGFWPHLPCSMLAAMSCTLGMGSICRFAFLSFQYGGAFILQFIMLSITFGLPMVSFFMTLGQYMGCGIMDMWKISPVFQGVGVASLVATTLIGIYGIVPVSWFFVYFRDSFITDGVIFKWGECMLTVGRYFTSCNNQTLTETFRTTVPQYLYNRVLQRSIQHPFANLFSELKFENVFNLAVVWLLVFICLSKGLKSYGKVVFAFAIFPLIGFLIVSVEILRQAQAGTEYIFKMRTLMYEVFTSGASWIAAGREVFFVWGINGAVLMQITSHNRFKHNIKRDSSIVILITLTTLLVAAFLGCACFSVIYRYERGRIKYMASSFETERNMLFLAPNPDPDPPIRHQWTNNLLLGEEMININTDFRQRSNYQVFRIATELFPAALANLGGNTISPFWSVLMYLTLISFGFAQQLAIWRCVIECIIAIKPAVMRTWETTITFVSCIMGFALGLPFTTEVGIFVVYFMDFCVGSAWWIMLIYFVQIVVLFIVRGKPYSADELVVLMTPDKFSQKWLSNVIAFSWNVITPISLLVLAITSFQNGFYSRMFRWYDDKGYQYWPIWIRQMGTFIQLLPLFAIPLIGMIQTCRYLAKGPSDLFERFQLLYRPGVRTPPDGQQAIYSDITGHSDGLENPGFTDDPPPKYTPPPSYNTATGLKLLKRLNSIRRSFRATLSSRQRSNITNITDVELAPANSEANGLQTLNVPFFISPQDLNTASTSRQSGSSES